MPVIIAIVSLCLCVRGWSADPPSPAAGATATAVLAFAQAVDQAPLVRSTRLRLLAARAERIAAGAFDDPQLSVNPEHDPALAHSRFGITHTEVLLSQPLARWGERDAQMLSAQAAEEPAEADLALVQGETAADLAQALSDRSLAVIRAAIAHQAAERATTALAQLTAALATAPGVRAQQLWSLQTRIEALAVQAGDADRDRADAEARVRSITGQGEPAALPPLDLPPLAHPSIDAAPVVRRARARLLAARAEEMLATSRRSPQVTLTAGWEGTRSDGAYEGMVSLSLPLHLSTYAAGEDAARARSAAAEAEERRVRLEAQRLLSTAGRERGQADAAAELARRTLERDDAALAAVARVLAGSGTDELAVGSVLDVLDRIAERRDALAQAQARAERAVAELWRLSPPTPASPPSGVSP